jgi:hypothetical protein
MAIPIRLPIGQRASLAMDAMLEYLAAVFSHPLDCYYRVLSIDEMKFE